MASFSDNFNRADGALGSNWSTVTGRSALQIASNAVNAASVAWCAARVATGAATIGNDQYAQATIANVGAFDYVGVLVRVDGSGNGYGVHIDGRSGIATNSIFKMTAGGVTGYLGTGSLTVSAGDVLRLEMSGSTLTLKKNGATVDTATDATYASGQPGILSDYGNTNVGILDDFSGGDLASATPLRVWMF